MNDGSYDELFVPLVGYLKSIGCDKQQHGSSRTLLDHLVGVSEMLAKKDCSDDLCIAGLFHSIYGTSHFRPKMISMGERDNIKSLIGVEAENIVYQFCILPKNRIAGIKRLQDGRLKDALYDLTKANAEEQKIWRSKSKIIQIYEDVVEDHVAELIASQMRTVYWQYEYHSKSVGENKHPSMHWHVLCGHNSTEITENGFE